MNIEAILIGLFSVAHTPEQAQHAAREIMRQHAHELAEMQRTNCDKVTCGPYEAQCACKDQADLIDPEVSS